MEPTPGHTAQDDRAEQRLAMLRELAEIGMALARDVGQQAAADPQGPDLGLVFSRIARAVRQTLALEARLEQDRRNQDRDAQSERARAVRLRGAARKTQVRRAVERAIDAEASDHEAENLFADLVDRLDDQEEAWFADRPVADLVAAICRDLGVTHDPALWTDDIDQAPTPEIDNPTPDADPDRKGPDWPRPSSPYARSPPS
jgi:hypothetical protein